MKNLTQSQLASLINVNDKAISILEIVNGYSNITLLKQLSKILNINIEQILKGEIINTNLNSGNLKKINNEMSKTHYINFIAYKKTDSIFVKKLYPEQDPAFYMPKCMVENFSFYVISMVFLKKAKIKLNKYQSYLAFESFIRI